MSYARKMGCLCLGDDSGSIDTIDTPIDVPLTPPAPLPGAVYPTIFEPAVPNIWEAPSVISPRLTPPTASSPSSSQIPGIISSATSAIKAFMPGGSPPVVYPAPAGATLPAGAIGFNAAGQPINSAGQVVASSFLDGSTFGVSNRTLALGGGALLIAALVFGGGFASGRR